jgi:hypothetical protein
MNALVMQFLPIYYFISIINMSINLEDKLEK